MTNPLMAHEAEQAKLSRTDCLAWCEAQNRHPMTARLGRWYYVNEVNGSNRCEVVEGTDGDNVHRLMNGETIKFEGWPEKRMRGYLTWLRGVAERGAQILPARRP
jgi:hypothetical protein